MKRVLELVFVLFVLFALGTTAAFAGNGHGNGNGDGNGNGNRASKGQGNGNGNGNGGGNGHVGPGDSNRGDVWLDTVGAPPGPGHEMDPHLPCADINLWGANLGDSSGTYLIMSWPPSGSKTQAYSGSWSYNVAAGGTQLLDTINVAVLIANAQAAGAAPVNKNGFHFKLDFSQDPQKHKTFWVNCEAAGTTTTTTPTTTNTSSTTTSSTTTSSTTTSSTTRSSTSSTTSSAGGGISGTTATTGSSVGASGGVLGESASSGGVGAVLAETGFVVLPLLIGLALIALGAVAYMSARRKRAA